MTFTDVQFHDLTNLIGGIAFGAGVLIAFWIMIKSINS